VSIPELTGQVVDRTAQIYGGKGVSDDFVLASELVGLDLLQNAGGQDAVHRQIIALMEIKKVKWDLEQRSQL
jgi:acyl-CoA dehydrogenase